MSKFKSVEELNRHRERLAVQTKQETVPGQVNATVVVGMGTCGQAAGAGEVLQALQREVESRQLRVDFRTVGCIGLCAQEPLVDIQLPGQPRITYANVKPSQVRRLVEDHLVGGSVIEEWAIGYVPPEW
jgi:NADP-reducing hydrogenase subunit HndB